MSSCNSPKISQPPLDYSKFSFSALRMQLHWKHFGCVIYYCCKHISLLPLLSRLAWLYHARRLSITQKNMPLLSTTEENNDLFQPKQRCTQPHEVDFFGSVFQCAVFLCSHSHFQFLMTSYNFVPRKKKNLNSFDAFGCCSTYKRDFCTKIFLHRLVWF